MESKRDIRKCVLTKRNLISKEEWEENSHEICKRVVAHPFFLNADEIYCYVDYKNEVGTREIIGQAWECGKKVAVPKVCDDTMSFCYIDNFEELETGYCNIMEPIGESFVDNDVKGAMQDKKVLIIMPGAAFDRKKNRIGYGKGFYDRYLETHLEYRRMALAFEMQIVDRIPADVHDICPEIIVTEENIYV